MFTTLEIVNAVSPASGNPTSRSHDQPRVAAATTPKREQALSTSCARLDRTPESKSSVRWTRFNPPPLSSNAPPIPQIHGRTPHPPHHSAPETQTSFAQTAAAPRFCPPTPLRRLRQSRAVGGRACAHRIRWWRRDEAWRSLCSSALHRLPCKTASHRRAYLLGCTPHRSTQCGGAPMDYIG